MTVGSLLLIYSNLLSLLVYQKVLHLFLLKKEVPTMFECSTTSSTWWSSSLTIRYISCHECWSHAQGYQLWGIYIIWKL